MRSPRPRSNPPGSTSGSQGGGPRDNQSVHQQHTKEGFMKRQRLLAVTVGVMVLSVGLVLANYGGGITPAVAKDLNGVTPNWDQNLPSASRFTTVFTGAVRDNNTGLVWEQAPDVTPRVWQTFSGEAPLGATNHCVNRVVGGTRGWRLPSVAELASVLDGSPGAVAPFVPASVFTGVQSAVYWTATSAAIDPDNVAWGVNFLLGFVGGAGKIGGVFHVWCVRGPMSESVY